MDINSLVQKELRKNIQTNTFVKGMNTDTSDMYMGDDQYKYAENIRIITNIDGNSGEVRLVEGTEPHQLKDKDGFDFQAPFNHIIAADSIRNIGIIIGVNLSSNTWYLYKIDFDTKTAYRIFGPCEEPIWSDVADLKKGRLLNTVLRYESENNIKLYVSDCTGKHPIMVFHIENNNYQGYNFDDMFAYQNIPLPSPEVEISTGAGSITAGKVQYAYRLYSKYGAATTVSPLSKQLSLYKTKFSGYPQEKKSGRAVTITHPDITGGTLDRIQIFRIQFEQSGQPPKIALIKDEPFIPKYKSTDSGASDINTISLDEFLSYVDSQIIPTQIESKGDYLFASNLKYAQDNVDQAFENFDARSYSKGNKYKNDSIFNLKDSQWDEIDSQNITHDAFNINNPYIEYKEEHWSEIEPQDIQNNKYVSGIPVRYRFNGIGKCICWKYVYEQIPTPTAQQQSNDVTGVKETKGTFRSEECYRFGIRLFNKRGVASSVKWIADIIMPETTYGWNTGIQFTINKWYTGWDDNWKDISGFEIVRCDRTISDRCTVTQGLVGRALQIFRPATESETPGYHESDYLCSPGLFSLDYISYKAYTIANSSDDTLVFSSPEYCYQPDDIKNILQSADGQLKLSMAYSYYVPSIVEQPSRGIICVSSNQTKNNLSYRFRYVQGSQGISSYFTVDDNTKQINLPWITNRVIEGDSLEKHGIETRDSADARTAWFLNYITTSIYNNKVRNIPDVTIKNTAFVDAPKYSDFVNEETFVYKNNTTSISGKQFINWLCPFFYEYYSNDAEQRIKDLTDNIEPTLPVLNGSIWNEILSPIGSGGKVILFSLNDAIARQMPDSATMPRIYIANVRKPVVPYGGYNKTQIDNSKYLSFGDYRQMFDADLSTLGDTSIQVFSGDTKIRAFTYNALHNWYDSTYKQFVKMATVYCVPVECDIDIQGQYGDLYGVDGKEDYRMQDTACAFDGFVQEKDAYLYNTAYNVTPDVISYYTDANNTSQFNEYDTRIHYSEQKTNNELIDSWLQFKAANFIDVDSRHGEITGMKLFKDKLIFWQERATGLAAVNERIVLKDSSENQVTLGTGGVLERTDYITTKYGMKKQQYAYETSDTGLYWWDGNKNEIVLYNDGYKVTPLSTVKTVQNYINNGEESAHPTIIYDSKYKELLCNVVNNEVLSYSEQIQQFMSVYKFNPVFKWDTNDDLYLSSTVLDHDCVFKYNDHGVYNYAYLFENPARPIIKYIVNNAPQINKTFDSQLFGGRFYGGENLSNLQFAYYTPLKQQSSTDGTRVTNIEYDFRLNIPRNNPGKVGDYGDRMRGKTMQCEFKSTSNDLDFSLQYIITKFRTSWT